MSVLYLVFAALTAFIGCALLALSQARNWREVIGGKVPDGTARIARRTGWAFLLTSLGFCILRDGPSFAALTWPLLFAASALSVAMLIAYYPNVLKRLTRPIQAIVYTSHS